MSTQRETFKEKPIYTLTEISQSLHSVIAKNYPRPYYIKAEIVRLNYYPHSGHCYPELAEKEGNAIKTQMRAIIWSSAFREINNRFVKITGEPMKEGINILCLATIEYDVKYGLSLHIQNVEPTYTLGDMVKNKLLVIERLKKEGIFTSNKEKKLALIPKRIAVISVETSKGYGDFMVTLANNPYHYKFECTLFPSILQGEKAIRTINEKLTEIETMLDRFDCVVIIRGGGGDVGLSCYDDYALASRVATFPLPVVSGIGHSTNETITDMVSYQSKITPTDVANFFIDQYRKVDQQLEDSKKVIANYVNQKISTERNFLIQSDSNLNNIGVRVIHQHNKILQSLENSVALAGNEMVNNHKLTLALITNQFRNQCANAVQHPKNQIDHFEKTIKISIDQQIKNHKNTLSRWEEKVALLSPESILKRGFSITYHKDKVLRNSDRLTEGDVIVTKLYQGEIKSIIQNSPIDNDDKK